MNLGKTFVNDLCSAAIEIIDNVVNHALIAGNRRRRNNNGIVIADRNLVEFIGGNASKRAHRLALTARRYYAKVFILNLIYLLYIDNIIFIKLKLAYFSSAFNNINHTATAERNLTLIFFSYIHDLL